ncbi:hypothetical protein M9458_036563, partial [Cirrhinus mrigala]
FEHLLPRDSTPLAMPCPSGSVRLLLPTLVALVPQRPSGSPPPPRLLEPFALPWPSGSSAPCWLIGSLSLSWAPPAPPRQPFLHYGSSLPWVTFMAAEWVLPGFSCSKSLLSSPWLLHLICLGSLCLHPGSSLHHHHPRL